MKTVVIPSIGANPVVIRINNGEEYLYPAGSTQTVPDEVAEIIDNINANLPKEAPEKGKQGQVWTKQQKGADWDNAPTELPKIVNGDNGKVLTAYEGAWAKRPSQPYYLHAIYISFTSENLGNVTVFINIITKSSTGFTYGSLLTWILQHGAKNGASGTQHYYVAGGKGSDEHVDGIYALADKLYVMAKVYEDEVPSAAVIFDTATVI